MKVTDPAGRTWRVSRRWLPWRRRSKLDMGYDVPSIGGLGDDPISMIIGLVLLVLVIPILILAIIVTLELLLLLLLLPFVILGRVVFGREWRVEVREGWTPVWDAPAGSWSESGRAITGVADGLRRGLSLQQATAPIMMRGQMPPAPPPPTGPPGR